MQGHDDDVNAVTYADDSPNIIVSGSDDTSIKVSAVRACVRACVRAGMCACVRGGRG